MAFDLPRSAAAPGVMLLNPAAIDPMALRGRMLLATGRRDGMAGQLVMAVVVALLGYGAAGSVLDFVRDR
ncbi:hypothetical protein ACIQF6_27940 [Kitasatospora sp. NPDC092948]|uniref:hypothetical protein n=1 Tax=Kitasatospora sp. NPDC092948 TaxID=3364088 RepID=UPI00382056D3